ncbi:hypothetical protein A6M21_01020 [Desulfotomaculum copahuensis]|uniref:Uncharacterized protein n=1 Tax=Desulfotomaculum copahuensis TaxID=1838280 RepID=A0A1B7LBV5_9FIRM|nr:hypothetical protein A6M21_01020 [Desulfotomaculum copahuensis]
MPGAAGGRRQKHGQNAAVPLRYKNGKGMLQDKTLIGPAPFSGREPAPDAEHIRRGGERKRSDQEGPSGLF